MKRTNVRFLALKVSQAVAALILLLSAGCASTDPSAASGGASASAANRPDTGKGGSQLWADNCARCHNIRTPSSYSDAEWQVAMHHMRVRANLTAEEHKKILEFLKSAN